MLNSLITNSQSEATSTESGPEAVFKLWSRKTEALAEKFRVMFDYHLCMQVARQIADGQPPRSSRFVGTGSQFLVYRIDCQKLALAVKLRRLTPAETAWAKMWMRCLDQLDRATIPHIPPQKTYWDHENSWLVQFMPFGEEADGHDQQLTAQVRQAMQKMHHALRQSGVFIDDIEQIRWIEGAPYCIDLSDLKEKSTD